MQRENWMEFIVISVKIMNNISAVFSFWKIYVFALSWDGAHAPANELH